MNIYRVDVKLYEDDKMSYGFLSAVSYTDAMSEALEYYGENETESIRIKYVTDSNILEIADKELVDKIEREIDW